MKPSDYIKLFGAQRDIRELEKVLSNYISANTDYIKRILSHKPDLEIEELIIVNGYELELTIGNDALAKWRNGNGDIQK